MDPFTMAQLAGMAIQGGTQLYNTFGKKNNPANAAAGALGEIPGFGQQGYNPFIQQGQQAQQQLNPQYNQMTSNPTDFYNQIMGQYKPSAGYQYREQQLNDRARNTAAAGGFGGTPGHQQMQSELINQLIGGDMQDFLKNILGIQQSGIGGLEKQAERGYGASGNLADYLGTSKLMQAGNQFQGQRQQNENRNTGLSSLASLIGGSGQRMKPGDTGQMDFPNLMQKLFGDKQSQTLNQISPTSFIQTGHAPYGGRT